MSILGLLANEGGGHVYDPFTVLMGCHGHHAILCNPNRFIIGDNIFLAFRGPTEEYACTGKQYEICIRAYFSQSVRYWCELCDVLVPFFKRAVTNWRNWYQFFTA